MLMRAGSCEALGDGDCYDEGVRAAVLRFQAARGLVPSGMVGPKTFAELNWPDPIVRARPRLEESSQLIRR
jgi:murein L,D-transpeptidase YcbB/YkuD